MCICITCFLQVARTMIRLLVLLVLLFPAVLCDHKFNLGEHKSCTLDDGRRYEHGQKFQIGCQDCRFVTSQRLSLLFILNSFFCPFVSTLG